MWCRIASVLLFASLLVGCFVDRRYLFDPERDRVLRVETGDRIYFTLTEPADNPRRWTYECDDADVEVLLDHERGHADVRIRISQGYDGPSDVVFEYALDGEGAESDPESKTFAITLFEITGDTVFWK